LSSSEIQSLLAASAEGAGTKPGCLILLNSQEDVCQLPAIEERYRQEYSLGVCAIGSVELGDIKMNRVSCEEAMQGSHWKRIYIPLCSADQIAQIALGLCIDQTTKVVAQAILAGTPVEIGLVNLGFTATTPESYRQMFKNYLHQVAGFGVVIAGNAPIAKQPAAVLNKIVETQCCQASVDQQSHQDARFDEKLLSERKALALPSNVVLRIAKSTVITPTAIDVLKKQKVEVYREGVRCL